MFGNSKVDKAVEKQAQQEAKDTAAIEKFGLDFDNYSPDDIKLKNFILMRQNEEIIRLLKKMAE